MSLNAPLQTRKTEISFANELEDDQTVGTLLSRSYQSGPALIGAIFGTGTNGAYIDHVTTIKKLGEEAINEAMAGGKTGGEYMVVNTEWGALDNGVSAIDMCMCDILVRI